MLVWWPKWSLRRQNGCSERWKGFFLSGWDRFNDRNGPNHTKTIHSVLQTILFLRKLIPSTTEWIRWTVEMIFSGPKESFLSSKRSLLRQNGCAGRSKGFFSDRKNHFCHWNDPFCDRMDALNDWNDLFRRWIDHRWGRTDWGNCWMRSWCVCGNNAKNFLLISRGLLLVIQNRYTFSKKRCYNNIM